MNTLHSACVKRKKTFDMEKNSFGMSCFISPSGRVQNVTGKLKNLLQSAANMPAPLLGVARRRPLVTPWYERLPNWNTINRFQKSINNSPEG